MVKGILTSTALLFLSALVCHAADTRQAVFSDRFHTLQVEVEGNPFAPPVILLSGQDRIKISFDELTDDPSWLRYSLVHCNADWQPSLLVDTEIVGGFNIADVRDYDYSRMTTTHYVNYNITIPNEEMTPLVSGNYLLQVFDESDPDTPLLQARFMVSEATASIAGDVRTVTDIGYNEAHQQVEFEVTVADDSKVENLFDDLVAVVTQNNRSDRTVAVRHPLRASSRSAVYEHITPLIFDAGNEYRRFETVSANHPGMHIEQVSYNEPYYYASLETDIPRTGYSYDSTQRGRYRVREFNSARSDIEADYIVTLFTLKMPRLTDGDVYIEGDLTDRRLDETSRMHYNPLTGCYERALLLKQGSYNYQYTTMSQSNNANKGQAIDGNYHQTSNEYTVNVYHRRRGERYDRLIGTTIIYSR